MPTVSIILPTFNRTRFLRLAVESVLAQTYADWEMIIADDGSDEETRAYLRGIAGRQVRALWLQHCGNPSQVRNVAIEAANGRYLAFLDSDDIWAPSKLQTQIVALRDRSECRWSYTACDRVDANGHPVINERLRALILRDGWIFEPLLRLEFSIAMPTVVAERDLVREVGGFDEEQKFGEFHDLCLRLAMKSQVAPVREVLCSIRAHSEHYSGDRIGAHLSWMRLYKKMADLAPTRTLRSHCARMRAQTSLALAKLQWAKSDYLGVWTTLGNALPFSWRYPTWWFGAFWCATRQAVLKISRQRRR
jgi:glycosyltransferase involved in cell wall biosynthesis